MSRVAPGRWVGPLRPAPAPRARVVLFPQAGAGPHALMPLVAELPPDLEVLGVTLPGRERRWGEDVTSLASDPIAVVRAVRTELATSALPTVLVGHSMGAVLAAGVALGRPRRFAGLVLSALPASGSPAQRAGRWCDRQLLELVDRGGGTPREVLSSPSWRAHVLALLRADLTLGVRLLAQLDLRLLDLPVTVLDGADDELATSSVPAAVPARRRTFPGGHFFLLEETSRRRVAAEIAAAVPAESELLSA